MGLRVPSALLILLLPPHASYITLLSRAPPVPPAPPSSSLSCTSQETINKLEETNHALTERLAWLGSKSFTVLVEDDPPAASIPENEEEGSKAAPATIRT